ncbi:MAG: MBL fold metallo-hydrolase [Thermomicrobiales bacterium]
MTFQLTVLGGSAAWPNPDQGCSSYLLNYDGTRILLDCGPDTLQELRRHSRLSDIDAVVISHCHADHILDLVTYRYALVYSEEQPDAPIPLLVPPGGLDILGPLGHVLGSQGESQDDFWADVFDLQEYDPSTGFKLDGLTISFAPTQHFTACFAIRVADSQENAIVYGADTGSIESLIDFAMNARLLIAEATADSHQGIAPEERGHLVPEDAGNWAARASVDRLLLTHLWHERPSSEVVSRAADRFDGPIDVATRGLSIYV